MRSSGRGGDMRFRALSGEANIDVVSGAGGFLWYVEVMTERHIRALRAVAVET